MGHDITAYRDAQRKQSIAYLRLFPSEAFQDGNVYTLLDSEEFRRSCSGSGKVVEFVVNKEHSYKCMPNSDSEKFLDEIAKHVHSGPVWVEFA